MGVRVILTLLLLAGVAGCGLFDTREPETPTDSHSDFIPPTTPDIVLQNFRAAIRARDVSNFLRCFVDTLNSSRSYRFVPTATAASRFPTVFGSWSLQSERSWFLSLTTFIPTSTPPSLTLSNGAFTSVSSDSSVYFSEYELTMAHGMRGIPETVRGNIQLVIAQNRNTMWEIVTWIDVQRGEDAGWSELKGRFAN